MVRVKNFRYYILFAASVVLLSLAVAGCFLFLFVKEAMKNEQVRKSLTASRKEIRTLVDEKDMLMARLVAMEVSAGDVDLPETVDDAGSSPAEEAFSLEADTASATGLDEPVPAALVMVKSFTVVQDKDSNRVKIRFTVEKVDESRDYISGRMFVVLEDEDADDGRIMTVPAVYLKDGRPTQISRGQYFSIARFKPVSMSARIDHPEEFTTATVFIYTPEGELFFEDTFSVDPIQYRQIPSEQTTEPPDSQSGDATPSDNTKSTTE